MKLKEFFLKFAAGLLCVVMAAALLALFFMNHQRNAARTENLKKQAQELKQQAEQRKEDAADLYDELYNTLFMRDIVCWGDNEMAGDGELSLPKVLRELANERLFAEVTADFSNSMGKEADPALSVTVNNMGVRNEGMREILVRAGVNELQVGQWMQLPGDTDPHNIELKDDTSWSMLHFAEQSEARFGSVEIDGITGTFTAGDGEYDEDHPRIAFVRDEEGTSVSLGAGTQIGIACATDHIGDIPVFFFEDDTADSVSGFVEDLTELVERYTETGESETAPETEPSEGLAYVVICTAEEDSELDEALREAFGDQYIRSDTYAYEMTEDGYKKLAEKVFDNLDSQGAFDQTKRQMETALQQLTEL